MRGSNTLFADIFPMAVAEKQRKGRSEPLHNLRNECLIDRYIFYGKSGYRYQLIIRLLSKEFFLSEITIPEIIDDNYELLVAAKKALMKKEDLKKKWPHLDWTQLMIVVE